MPQQVTIITKIEMVIAILFFIRRINFLTSTPLLAKEEEKGISCQNILSYPYLCFHINPSSANHRTGWARSTLFDIL